MSSTKEICTTCGSLCERVTNIELAMCMGKTENNLLIPIDYEKIQAKSTRRKKALRQLNRSLTEWQRLAVATSHHRDRIKRMQSVISETLNIIFSDERTMDDSLKIDRIKNIIFNRLVKWE